MREIKFRAWNSKGMTYFTLNHTGLRGLTELMQYTGLKDNYGIEIYEGDIVGDAEKVFGIVVWDKENARFTIEFPSGIDTSRMSIADWFDHWKYTDWRVIGNKYENPSWEAM